MLTGGACAGKTTALATLSVALEQMGFKVLQVPEAATMLMKGGCLIDTVKLTHETSLKLQKGIMQT